MLIFPSRGHSVNAPWIQLLMVQFEIAKEVPFFFLEHTEELRVISLRIRNMYKKEEVLLIQTSFSGSKQMASSLFFFLPIHESKLSRV